MRGVSHQQWSAAATFGLLLLSCGAAERTNATRDDLGRAVPVPSKVGRVVTLAPNLTEIVFAIGAGARVVATDDFSDAPAAARRVAKVGGLQPNVERIVAVRPDLVLASTSGNHPALATAFAPLQIPLFVVRTDRLDDVPRAVERIGQLLGSGEARRVAGEIRQSIARERRSRATAPRVLFAIWTDPLYVAGRGTFGDDLIALAGGRNVVDARGWPEYAIERVVSAPPDLIIYPARSVTPEQLDAFFRRAPLLRDRVKAVGVDENLFTRPGPRVAEAARQLNAIFDAWEKSR